jgi:hypothetical protein
MLNFFIALIGESRCLVTSKPQDNVWGMFNSLIANKYLVILEELSEKQTMEYEGVIKDLVTGGRLTINTKGVKQYTIDSYLKFVALSNTVTCKTKVGDRRNILIKCSNQYVGNSKYFERLREYQADKRLQMMFYERLIERPNIESFNSRLPPVTEYQKTIQNSNRDDYDLFLEDWIASNTSREQVTIQSKFLYDRYVDWVRSNEAGTKASSNCKFVKNITLFLGSLMCTNRTKKCVNIILDVPRLMLKYNIELCESDEASPEEKV